VKPLVGQVLIRIEPDSDTTESGLILPQRRDIQERTQVGRVIEAGGLRTRSGVVVPSEPQPGDRVILKRARGTEFKVDGVPHAIIPEEHILAVIT